MDTSEIRDRLGQIDSEMRRLFLERMALAREAARERRQDGQPALDRALAREVLSRGCRDGGEMEPYLHCFFSSLSSLSQNYQEMLNPEDSPVSQVIDAMLSRPAEKLRPDADVACQGVEGAYSQIASDRIFSRCRLHFYPDFSEVFDAVERGDCQYGVLPVENSAQGSVRAVCDLLRERQVYIVQRYRLCISHCLLVRPGTDLRDIRVIYSHEQALGQCSRFLRSLGDRVRIAPCANTAIAARMVSESGDPHAASISSAECQELYGLQRLDIPIQNSENNYTKFICIAREPMITPGANRISLILFLKHSPGALYDILTPITAMHVNLLKLDSVPIVGSDFEFMFFVDLQADITDPSVQALLAETGRRSGYMKLLGCYPEIQ